MPSTESVLEELQTLKSHPLSQQVRTIGLLAESNPDLFDLVQHLITRPADDRIFRAHLAEDKQMVVRTALLAVLLADVATIASGPSQRRTLARLEELCRRLAVRYEDVVTLAGHASALESLLAGRRILDNGTS